MPGLYISKGPSIWVPRATREQMMAGDAFDRQVQKAEDAHAKVVAPPCPACGVPIKDSEWDRHKAEAHNGRQVVQPYGTADSRELLILGTSKDDLDRKEAKWRELHPGLTLSLAGEGREPRYKNILWQRYRVITTAGKPVE